MFLRSLRFLGLPLLSTLTLLLGSAPAASAGSLPPVDPGFPNVPQTPGTLLSGLNAPQQGRTAILAYHNGVLFTVPELPSSAPNSDFQVRTWDITDPTNPVETAQLGISPMPVNAHGYFKSGDYVVLGPNWPPEAPWSFRALAPGSVERTTFPNLEGPGVRGQLFQPWFVGETWWSYGEITGDASIAFEGVELARWDHLGLTGVVGHPFLLGDLLIFASDQSRTGVATYDVSDPTNPVLLDVLTTGGPGGYWPEIWGGDGKLYIVFPYRENGNGFRVVDATDPTDLQFVTDKPLPGDASMYIQFQDEFAFMGGHKVDMRSLESVLFLDGANAVRPNDGGTGVDTSQFLLPLGNLLVTGGIGDHQGMAIWAHQADPDTRGPSVGYHIPQAGRANYPVGAPISLLIHETIETPTLVNGISFIVRPLGGSAIAGRLTYAFDDVLTFTPDAPLADNTTYEVVLPAGGIKDAAGNGMEGYSFTFSTGSSVGGNGAPAVDSLTASAYPVAPGAQVTLTASATDPDSDPLEYRFDFGDGSPKTAWSSSASVATSYADAGHYQATVQVRDPSGSLASSALTLTVVVTPAGPQPTRSSPVVCDVAGRQLWVANPDNGTVTRLDADTLATVFEVAVCDDPRSLALASTGEVWVACHGDDRLRVLDAGSGGIVTQVATGYGSAPVGIVPSPDGATLYVALEGKGAVRRYDAASRSETASLDLGPMPRALAVTGDGTRLLVTRFLSPKDWGEVWDVDTASFVLSRTLRLQKFGDEDNRDGTASGRGVANYLTGIAIAPDGGTAWVTSNKPNTERGTFFGPDLDSDNSVRNIVSRLDLVTGDHDLSVDLDNSDSASAVAFSPLGDYLFVALQGNDEVVVLDALSIDSASGLGSFFTRLGTGAAPQGLCFDPLTGRTLVKNFLGRTLSTIETDALFRFGDKTVSRVDTATVASEALTPTVLNGKRLFYHAGDPRMSAEGYLSCASCHLDGGQDGRVWDFTGRGEGFRNTTSLRGRSGMAHGNVHWSANFDEIQDFENDIRGAFGGLGFLDDGDFAATSDPLGPGKTGLSADLDALAAYVSSLGFATLPRSPFREASGSMTPDGLAGRAVFESLGCASCHAGQRFTDSTLGTATLHDVGTLRTSSGGRLGGPLPGIDTPTLRGLWATAPYFHDGSARTVDEVFSVAGGVLLQAEDGALSGGAYVVDQYVDLNYDDTVHNRSLIGLDNQGARVTFNGVDGGAGGSADLEIRYSAGWPDFLEVVVNGSSMGSFFVEPTANDPQWRQTVWERLRIEGLTLLAGSVNTIELVAVEEFSNTAIDDVLVTTADEQTLAQPHRDALALSPSDRNALVAYLLQLDGTLEGDGEVPFFADGFESGDFSGWSSVGN